MLSATVLQEDLSPSTIKPAETGLARQQALADQLTSESSPAILLVWRSQPALVATQQDTNLPRFHEASAELEAAGWPVVVRRSGGSACPVAAGTVQIAMIEPALPGATMDAKYDALTKHLQTAFRAFGVETRTGAVADAYCSGRYDLSIAGKKIAGAAQRWFRNKHAVRCIVSVASVNIEEAPDIIADAVNRFYRSAGSPICCKANAITSLRLSSNEALLAGADLTSAFMNQLARGNGRALQQGRFEG